MIEGLDPRTTPGATIQKNGPVAWRLAIPSGPPGEYRLAQLDDYTKRPRGKFPWRPPLSIELQARSSAENLPGTWGFGFWNDPFSLALGLGGGTRRLPALPNTAWFFFASPPNYLSLRDELPAAGALAATFRAPTPQFPWLLGGAVALPFLILPGTARLVRRMARRVVQQDAALIPDGGPPVWRHYRITWDRDRVSFYVDAHPTLTTRIVPRSPLGLVIWIDNQYAAFPPNGRLAYGTLENPEPAWIEIRDLGIESL